MKRIIISFVAMVLLLFASPAFGASAFVEAINELNASGKQSNDIINHSVIDLTYLSDESVTAYTYLGANETLTVNNFSVSSQSALEAHDKLTRFIFELTNRYRPDTDLALSGTGSLPTVHAWTYGTMKDEAMWAIVYGLEDCLNNPPYDWRDKNSGSGSGSYIDKYSPENIETTLAVIFNIGKTTYSLGETTYTMDVAPEITNDRIFVPVRYAAYAAGIEEDDIKWDGTTKTVAMTKEETTIQLTIGSTTQLISGEPVTMDVAPYIKNSRTMLPARWVAEPLGAQVDWDEETQEVTIFIAQQENS